LTNQINHLGDYLANANNRPACVSECADVRARGRLARSGGPPGEWS
jgi:hypothetical protein